MLTLVIEPMKPPYEKEIDEGLESLQHEVDGYIEALGLDEDACIICNEEGKINGMELNRAIRDENGKIADIIAGTFLIVGNGEEDFCSLKPDAMKRYKERFKYPERFMRFGGEIIAMPIRPERGRPQKAEPER